MLTLTIRTDKPEAEIGLYDDDTLISTETWTAHRELAETIHQKILLLLKSQGNNWKDLGGIVCYRGPGSFTGLRIGITLANTLAFSLKIPIIGAKGDNWASVGAKSLKRGLDDGVVMPHYGAPVHITKPRK